MSKLLRLTIKELQNLKEYKDINKLIQLQQHSLCETKIKKLLTDLKQHNMESATYIFMLQKYASCLIANNKYAHAELQLLNSYELSSQIKSTQLKYSMLTNLFLHQIQFCKDNALKYAPLVEKELENNNEPLLKAVSCNAIAALLSSAKSQNYCKCASYLQQALIDVKRDSDYSGITLHNIAVTHRFEIEHHNAIADSNRYIPKKKLQLLKEEIRKDVEKEFIKKGKIFKVQSPMFTQQYVTQAQYNISHNDLLMLEESIFYGNKSQVPLISKPVDFHMMIDYAYTYNPSEYSHITNLLAYHSLALEIFNSSTSLDQISKAMHVSEYPTADKYKTQITSKKCINTMLELAYIYSVSGELETAEYWTKYALNTAVRNNLGIETVRAQILLASIFIDTKQAAKASSLLTNIVGESYPVHLKHIERLAHNLMVSGGLTIKKELVLQEGKEADLPYYHRLMQYIVPMWNMLMDMNKQY